MTKSESISNLAKALITFHIKVDKIKKDAKNPFFKSSYASLSNILDAINTPLNEAGLCFSQFPVGENELVTLLVHAETGEFLEGSYVMRPVKDDPQGKGSVITYQRRYALAAVLGLNIDEDDDANTATHGAKTPEKAAEKAESDNKPWLNENTPEFNGAVEKLRKGTTTIEGIKAVRKLSKATESKLKELIQTVPA